MEKVAGFEIELTNGIIILAIPRGDNSSFTVSNLTFTITQEGKAFAQVAIAVDLQADSTDIGVKSIRKAMLEKRIAQFLETRQKTMSAFYEPVVFVMERHIA